MKNPKYFTLLCGNKKKDEKFEQADIDLKRKPLDWGKRDKRNLNLTAVVKNIVRSGFHFNKVFLKNKVFF